MTKPLIPIESKRSGAQPQENHRIGGKRRKKHVLNQNKRWLTVAVELLRQNNIISCCLIYIAQNIVKNIDSLRYDFILKPMRGIPKR